MDPEILKTFNVDISSWTDHESSMSALDALFRPSGPASELGFTRAPSGAPWESLTSLKLYDCSTAYPFQCSLLTVVNLSTSRSTFLWGFPWMDSQSRVSPPYRTDQHRVPHQISWTTPTLHPSRRFASRPCLSIDLNLSGGTQGGVSDAQVRLSERSYFKLRSFELSWFRWCPINPLSMWGEQDILSAFRTPQFSSLVCIFLVNHERNDTCPSDCLRREPCTSSAN